MTRWRSGCGRGRPSCTPRTRDWSGNSTERERAEAALRESAESFDSLFNAAVEGIVIAEGGTIVAANQALSLIHI